MSDDGTDVRSIELGRYSTTGLRAFLAQAKRPVVLFPVGSVEPHGPHLPLATDTMLSAENARRAAWVLRERGVEAVVAPALPYGVTDFAAGFAGATTIPKAALVAVLVGAAEAWLDDGFHHVCLINHHLEPGQLAALTEAEAHLVTSRGRARVSCPQVVSRRWGAQLGDEFRSGACHAGSYETSMVLAIDAATVDTDAAAALPEVPISLSTAIRDGLGTFVDAGATQAYTGRPAEATAAEGEALLTVLTEMVATEVLERLT